MTAEREQATSRLADLIHATIADEAATAIADGRAALRSHDGLDGTLAVELDPVRPHAAGLIASVEHDRLVHCEIGRGYGHEIFAVDPVAIAAELRTLVRALIEGTYVERERDGRRHSTARAEWPEGGSSRLDLTADAGGWQTEWRLRAYEPY